MRRRATSEEMARGGLVFSSCCRSRGGMRGWPLPRPTLTPAASARTQAQNAPILRYNSRMGKSRYSVLNHQAPHFVTCTAVKWRLLFADPRIVNILLNAIRYLQAENALRLHGYVVMENHLHMIVSGDNVSAAIARFKTFTARQIVEYLRENGQRGMLRELSFAMRERGDARQHKVWEADFHPQAIAGEDMLRQKLDYMHANPVRRGYVDEPTCWRNSSARNYAGMEGVLEVEILG